MSGGPKEVAVFEKEAVPQAVTADAAPTFDVTRLKEEVAPEAVPLTISEVEEAVTISEVEEAKQVITAPITDMEAQGHLA